VRIFARSTLRRYVASRVGYRDQAALGAALDAWFFVANRAAWKSSAELKSQFRSASIIASDRAVFNIKGNDYRLVASIDYEKGLLWIEWLGTHAEYDRIDARTVVYERP
jgi:mRNA interferase HigB